MAQDTVAQGKHEQEGRGRGGMQIHVSPAVLSFGAVILVSVLFWCFYFGFMVGRGQNPEEHLAQMTSILSSEEKPADEAKQPDGQAKEAEGAQEGAQEAAGAEAAQTANVQGTAQGAQPGQTQAVPGYPTFPSTQQADGADAAGQAADAKKAQQNAAKEQAAKAPYTFVYRMATVRTRDDARKEQERYDKKGVRTSIKSTGKTWGLFCTFKGTDADAEQFLNKVKKAGLAQPARVGRKAN